VKDDYGGKTSALSFSAVAGTDYRIAVDGLNGAAGRLVLAGGYQHSINTPSGAATDPVSVGKVNLSGHYAGTTAQSPPRAYLMTTMQQDLGDLGGGSSSANGLNSFDQVVGVSGYAFIWDQANGIRRLDSSTTSSSAIAINDASLVVGSAHVNTCGGSARPNAVYWQAGVFYALPQLGG